MSLFEPDVLDPEPAPSAADVTFRVVHEPEVWNIRPVARYGKGRVIIGTQLARGRNKDHAKLLEKWVAAVRAQAEVAMAGRDPMNGAVEVVATFYVTRPASVSQGQRSLPIVRPDVDKLLRATLDALTNVVYADDSRIVTLRASKFYADGQEPAGVKLTVRAR